LEKIRASLGTAAILGLATCKMDAFPTTAYLMIYLPRKCHANCAFCPQARESETKAEHLSRVLWPVYPLEGILNGFSSKNARKYFKRVCIQALNHPKLFQDLIYLVKKLKSAMDLPISLSIPPLKKEELKMLNKLGIKRVGIALDAATPAIFSRIKGKENKGPYKWDAHLNAIKEALEIFGPYNVTSHLIIGLGETEREAVNFIQDLFDLKINTGLFAFTPIKGTALQDASPPNMMKYRKIQLARYLILNKFINKSDLKFDDNGTITDFGMDLKELHEIIRSGLPFLTSGCPDCNRPYYNERPGRELYNFPKPLTLAEVSKIEEQFQIMLENEDE
jgi:biotin synthase-related radical SAM superfamily protein